MKKQNTHFSKYISIAIMLFAGILFVAKFAGSSILRLYVESGMGNCQKIPILCMSPAVEIIHPDINKEYITKLIPNKFPEMIILTPDGFLVIQERVKRVYYKKNKRKYGKDVIYLLHEKPGFFINLFPRLKNQGVNDDYEFIRRTMYARLNDIKSFKDAFFVIMKGIFIPDLGNQRNVKMSHFMVGDKKGFINYNIGQPDNYFDCNIIDKNGDFFKIYIRDIGANLDLNKVLAIISTVKKAR